ncbi:GAF and ANTAR domain-containing protein [Segeticoccus rhizosphaerae]|jgi:transcriptional regulator with GAF, ATPase, and Fis domain|uniref:GAF and ANTAR domain-containing protein n=1 Tax=Segeticoccus rhizosphaerae TaxID=1104777 RepID=UPI0010C0FD67|nr:MULTISPECIES: GAF and ANTAR domain-containing protein [Intrasporangiaceae]
MTGRAWAADERFGAIVRSLQARHGVQDTLQRSVEVAVELFDGCDYACVSLVHRNKRIETPAYTDDIARRGDDLQYELGQGPCLDAIWSHETVRSDDLTAEHRWPDWGPRAAEQLGIRSMLCFQLFTSRDSLGALNLYGTTVNAFDDSNATVGYALAAHVSVALAGEQELADANLVLADRTIIGRAEGILMERFGLTGTQALEALHRIATQQDTDLHSAAAELVNDGRPRPA